MNTKSVVDKLNTERPELTIFLDDRKEVLAKTSKKSEVVGEIRGYLAALRRMEVISDVEFRLLLSYYTLNRYQEHSA